MSLLGNYCSDMFGSQLLAIFRDFSTCAAHLSIYVVEDYKYIIKIVINIL